MTNVFQSVTFNYAGDLPQAIEAGPQGGLKRVNSQRNGFLSVWATPGEAGLRAAPGNSRLRKPAWHARK